MDSTRFGAASDSQHDLTRNKALLSAFIQENHASLRQAIRTYAWSAGVPAGLALDEVTNELLDTLVVEALTHASRYDQTQPPRPWLLRIAANLIKRHRVATAKQVNREPLGEDMPRDDHAETSDDDFFDSFASLAVTPPGQDLESDQQVAAMLALVSPSDQEILRLALLYELRGDQLAQALGISNGAARVRLSRAIKRLGDAWHREQRQPVG